MTQTDKLLRALAEIANRPFEQATILPPEVVAAMTDRESEIRQAIAFLDTVNVEDRQIVEGAYRGARAPLTRPGPIHQLERPIHHFIGYFAERLTDGGKRLARAAAE